MKYDERTCKVNMDTGCVELRLRDGRMISIDCTGVEDELDVTMAQRTELDYLILQNPMTCFDPLYRIGQQIAETFSAHNNWTAEEIHAAHRLDTVLDKFLKTMQTTTARLQEKLLKPEVRQKGKEQVKEKARDSVLQLLNRLQAEQGQNKPTAQPRKQEGHSEI